MMDIRTVLCPLDFTDLSRRELDLAADVARRFSARLILEHNVDPQPPGGLAVSWMWRGAHVGQGADREANAEARLREVMTQLPPEVVCEARLTRGPVDEALAALARQLPAELLVMGSHGWSDPHHRSVTERVLRFSPCPVLTLAEEGGGRFMSGWNPGENGGTSAAALIAVNPSAAGRRTLAYGLDLCESFHLRPLVLHVDARASRRDYDMDRLARDRQQLEALLPPAWRKQCECIAAAGKPAASILEVAERSQARFLVLGCHDRFSFRRLAGHTIACTVLHGSKRPVWFLPASAQHGAWAGAAA
jgi:universal stress protein A